MLGRPRRSRAPSHLGPSRGWLLPGRCSGEGAHRPLPNTPAETKRAARRSLPSAAGYRVPPPPSRTPASMELSRNKASRLSGPPCRLFGPPSDAGLQSGGPGLATAATALHGACASPLVSLLQALYGRDAACCPWPWACLVLPLACAKLRPFGRSLSFALSRCAPSGPEIAPGAFSTCKPARVALCGEDPAPMVRSPC